MSLSDDASLRYEDLVARSAALPYRFPTGRNLIAAWAARSAEVEEHAAGVRPILHEAVAALLEGFLALKRAHGSPPERALYADLDRVGFVTRLLARRPLAFFGGSDAYLLRDGTRGKGGFEAIGTASERAPLVLSDLLSYDEMALAALLGVSVPTHFLNAGERSNEGWPGSPGSCEERGIYVALVGARFERPGQMEYRHLVVSSDQNTAAQGYGADADPDDVTTRQLRLWARFYGREHLPTFAEAQAERSGRYLKLGGGALLDRELYARRMRVTVEVFLREANARGREARRPVYAHAVGLGLGVWRIDPRQTGILVEVFAAVLREVSLPHLSDLDFSWFGEVTDCGGARSGEVLSGAGETRVRIHLSRREPAARLRGEHAGKLLVAMYAWDGNSFPGNEYWLGLLSASGDPAAACCSTITELQNPDLNPRVAGPSALVFGPAGEQPLTGGGAARA